MTCIAGIVDGAKVWIGGDSAAYAGCERFPSGDLEPKVFKREGMLFGYSGPSRFGQILQHALEIPPCHPDAPVYRWLVVELMPAFRRAIVEHDGVKINDPNDGWEFLLGFRGGLYSVCHDLSVTVLPEYGAVGCGHMVALGSLYSTRSGRVEDRLILALEASAHHDVHVSGPFVIEVMD